MTVKSKNGFRYQMKSFVFAYNGLKKIFFIEKKAIIHLIISTIAILCGFILSINTTEWSILIITIVVVFSLEMVNTAIEKLVDIVQPEFQEKAGLIKDLAAGAVLFASIGAVAIGLIIFLPKIFGF